jgi:hypothetical protein
MKSVPSSNRHGGVLTLALTGVGLLSVGTVAAVTFKSTSSGSASSASAASKAPRMLRPGEVAVVLHLVGITPEGLAAAGGTAQTCNQLFDTGMVYCLQSERLDQLQLAHRDVNLAGEKAVRPSSPGAVDSQGRPIALAQANISLADQERAGFAFVTTGLDPGIAAKLATIKANAHWGLPAPYLTVERTDEEWLSLRGALVARRFATQHNTPLDPRVAQILAAAEANTTVARALTDSAASLAGIADAWRVHETTGGP